MNMVFKDVVKYLAIVVMIAQTLMSAVGGMFPIEVSAVINAVIGSVAFFIKKIGAEPTPEV